MRTISFHKALKCPKCGVNPVERWDKLCADCKKVQGSQQVDQVGKDLNPIGGRQAAAIIQTNDGQQIVVDKFGKEVKNHGYDLEHDPRGYKKNGQLKPSKTVI